MTADEIESGGLYEQLCPGDRVEVAYGVTVGSSGAWQTTTTGRVLRQ